MCFLGDGAVNQGAFHESLNLAALWDLPVIYIIENNGYSMGTSQARSSAHPEGSLAARAAAYGIEWENANGENIYEVRAVTQRAIERAHKESKPTVIEFATYRYKGHSVADANTHKYRTKDEVERYQNEHDPISLWKQQLVNEGVLTDELAATSHKEAQDEANASADFAEQSPFPEPESIMDDVYWEVDNDTESGRTGTHFFNPPESAC